MNFPARVKFPCATVRQPLVRRSPGDRVAGSSERMAAAAFAPEVGSEPFPGHRLLRLRGRGAFASVWEATTPNERRVALKFMSSQNGQTGSTTAREIRSLQCIQALIHPHLLRIHDVWLLPGCIAIAMDLADASLLDLMLLYHDDFEKHVEVERLFLYLGQAAKALDFLNAKRHLVDGRLVGYQHGDIKPNNILLVGDNAYLADYGLATVTSGPSTPCPRHGTMEYAAPEIFSGYLTEASDQFSLAVTYHLLRTGQFPYPPPPSPGEIKRSFTRPPPDLSHLPEGERSLVARALSTIPQNRFPTCSDFIGALALANKSNAFRFDFAPSKNDAVTPLTTPRSGIITLLKKN